METTLKDRIVRGGTESVNPSQIQKSVNVVSSGVRLGTQLGSCMRYQVLFELGRGIHSQIRHFRKNRIN